MNQTSRPAAAVAALALSALPILLGPSGATASSAPDGATKAGIEHAERLSLAGDGPTKAQIERQEREQSAANASQGGSRQQRPPSSPSSPGDTGAAAWQLALSAALGAALTGGVVVASRQVTHHRHAVAS